MSMDAYQFQQTRQGYIRTAADQATLQAQESLGFGTAGGPAGCSANQRQGHEHGIDDAIADHWQARTARRGGINRQQATETARPPPPMTEVSKQSPGSKQPIRQSAWDPIRYDC